MDDNDTIKFADLFCGIGSFHHSLVKLGWECVFACDINEDARATYEANHDMQPQGDICNVKLRDVPSYDVLCSGFPCQAFSIAGQHKGFKDPRGNMFLQTMRFVKHHQPKVVILENVVGLTTHDKGRTFKTIQAELKNAGYHFNFKILKCSDYGIPQMRRRLFIVATNAKKHKLKFPASLLDFSDEEKSRTLTEYLNEGRPKSKHLTFEKDTAYTIRCGGKNSPVDDGHNWDGYWVTKKGGKSRFVHRLTIDDCLKLQGFDEDEFELVGDDKAKWLMVGNTIPTIFTHLVGHAVHYHLSRKQPVKKRPRKK